MNTSAEQINGKINTKPEKGKDKRLYIDLDICTSGECKKCVIQCSYLYHRQDPGNNGIVSVAELAVYSLVCRRCEEPHCVNSCPQEALEQQKDKENLLIRHNMRCISCKSCSHACPYGTIYPENVPHLVHNCDFCFDRINEENEPLCIKSCPYGALSLREATDKPEENIFLVGDNLIVHSTNWNRDKA